MGDYGWLVFLILFVYLIIQLIGASLMSRAAVEKGYGDDTHAWAICFFLGIFGYLYIIALPDKIAQGQNQKILEALTGKEGNDGSM